ncbi:MAG: hypothetical protein GY768_09095 [Planctomycetaceae bacterium]|nr:hypothetical protein [Planctomycetaceae bacterium]
MHQKLFVAFVMGASLSATIAFAQNVTNYATMPNSQLFLLREPAVHRDLKLSDLQLKKLRRLNETLDGSLLASRNKAAETAEASVRRAIAQTQQALGNLFTEDQLNRLRQIKYRVRGIAFVLTEDAAKELELTADQKEEIQGLINESQQAIRQIQQQMTEGKQTLATANQAAAKAQTELQQQILSAIDDKQKETLVALVGRSFDIRQLGKVAFRAPHLSEDGVWINSPPLEFSKLRGKVVALHFWAFG